MSGMGSVEASVEEVATGVFRLVLPLGIHGIPSVNGYLLADDDGDTLVDCGIAVENPDRDPADDDGTAPLEAALAACGSSFGGLARLVIARAHRPLRDRGEVVRRSDAELWMHTGTDRGEQFRAGDRGWSVVPTPGHSPGHICLWADGDRLLCSGDHLLKNISPPVTFERGFERDPMGSYLASLETVQELAPALVLPGHGDTFAGGARRAAGIERNKRQRLDRLLGLIESAERTVADITTQLYGPQPTGSRLHFAVAEVLAYLAYFEVRGKARRQRDRSGVYRWRAL